MTATATFQTRIQDRDIYPTDRLITTEANLNTCVAEAETLANDPPAARFYAGRLQLVRDEIAKRS